MPTAHDAKKFFIDFGRLQHYNHIVKSFRKKILLVSAILLTLSAAGSFYSYYKLNSIYGVIERNKIFEIPFSQSLSGLKADFDSYRFEVNKIVSAPTSYTSDEINNSVFKIQTESQILKLQKMSQDYPDYSAKIEEANKAFKNYFVAAAAIVDAFSSSADMDNQKETTINSFSQIMKTNEAAFTATLDALDTTVANNMILGTSAVRSYFSNAGFWVWTLFIFMVLSFAALYLYVTRVTHFIKAVNTSLEDIRDGHYSPEEISNNIPLVSEPEFFELADKVTRISSLIYNDLTINKSTVKNLEDDILRLRTITTYTTSILNSLDSGIMVTDNLLKVSFINQEFEKFWRVKRSSVIDSGVEDLPFIRLIDGWKEALRSGKTTYFTSTYKTMGKRSKDVGFCVLPLMDSAGKTSIGTITLTKPSAN